jgi:drug/metabolite transporter (DMT)-like permease
MQGITAHTGEIAALTAALCWALSTVMYRPIGLSLSPLVMNLFKGMIAVALLCLTVAAGHLLAGRPPGGVSTWGMSLGGMSPGVVVLLAVSGVVGIGIGDTAFFAALWHLGSRRALLLGTLAPPLTALIGWAFLGETLSLGACAGIGLTVAGVAWVITERSDQRGHAPPGRLWWGVGCGVFFALTQAVGAVISRKAMVDTQAGAELTALVRLVAGTLAVGLMLPFAQRLSRDAGTTAAQKKPMTRRGWALFFVAVTTGTYLGIWLQQVALDHTDAGVAQTLQSTSPLFVLPIAAVLGERVSPRAIAGAAVAVAGIVLLFGNS